MCMFMYTVHLDQIDTHARKHTNRLQVLYLREGIRTS